MKETYDYAFNKTQDLFYDAALYIGKRLKSGKSGPGLVGYFKAKKAGITYVRYFGLYKDLLEDMIRNAKYYAVYQITKKGR